MTLKQMLLDYLAGHPGKRVTGGQLEHCSRVLQQFLAQADFCQQTAGPGDKAYTRISIVMPAYNKVEFIERSILSVLNQGYPNLQFVIMDGGSTDGTLDVIRKYEKHLLWRSEPDRGQSDALNKALSLADGELVGWQNADDVYFPGALHRIHAMARQKPRAVLYSGSVARIDCADQVISVPYYVRPTRLRLLYLGYVLSSQGVFVRRAVQTRVGLYDPELYSGMDLDLWLKLLAQGRGEFTPELIGGLRLHENTKTALAPERGHAEVKAIRKKYGVDDSAMGWRVRRNLLLMACLFEGRFLSKLNTVTLDSEAVRWS